MKIVIQNVYKYFIIKYVVKLKQLGNVNILSPAILAKS